MNQSAIAIAIAITVTSPSLHSYSFPFLWPRHFFSPTQHMSTVSQHSPTPRKMQSLSYNPQPASTHINTHHNTTQHITQVTTHSSCPIPSLLHLPNSRNPHSQKIPLNHIIPSSHIPHPTSQLAHGSPLQNPTFFHCFSSLV